jgi:hypothetical protein
VQVHGGVELGAQYGVEPRRGEGGEDSIVEHAGGVDDGGERVHATTVTCAPAASRACTSVPMPGAAGSSRRQYHVQDTVGRDEMARQQRPQRSGAAGDRHGAVGWQRPWHGEHWLADVARLRHGNTRGARRRSRTSASRIRSFDLK